MEKKVLIFRFVQNFLGFIGIIVLSGRFEKKKKKNPDKQEALKGARKEHAKTSALLPYLSL